MTDSCQSACGSYPIAAVPFEEQEKAEEEQQERRDDEHDRSGRVARSGASVVSVSLALCMFFFTFLAIQKQTGIRKDLNILSLFLNVSLEIS